MYGLRAISQEVPVIRPVSRRRREVDLVEVVEHTVHRVEPQGRIRVLAKAVQSDSEGANKASPGVSLCTLLSHLGSFYFTWTLLAVALITFLS